MASARAAAVISESIGIPPHLSLPPFPSSSPIYLMKRGGGAKAMTMRTIETPDEPLAAGALGAGNWLRFAAAPTFALMALLTGVLGGGPQDVLCSAAHEASPLGGMVPM